MNFARVQITREIIGGFKMEMTNNNQQQTSIREPKRESFKNEMEFDLERIKYWYSTKDADHPLFNAIKSMESRLLYNSAVGIVE